MSTRIPFSHPNLHINYLSCTSFPCHALHLEVPKRDACSQNTMHVDARHLPFHCHHWIAQCTWRGYSNPIEGWEESVAIHDYLLCERSSEEKIPLLLFAHRCNNIASFNLCLIVIGWLWRLEELPGTWFCDWQLIATVCNRKEEVLGMKKEGINFDRTGAFHHNSIVQHYEDGNMRFFFLYKIFTGSSEYFLLSQSI